MKTATFIASSLLAIAVSGAPLDFPKPPVDLPSSGLPSLSSLPTADNAGLPVKTLPVRRADLPVVDATIKDDKLPTLPTLPKLPVDNVNLPVKRLDAPIVGGILKDVPIVDSIDPEVHLPLPVSIGLTKRAADIAVNAPITLSVEDIVEGGSKDPSIAVPTVGIPEVKGLPKVSREIKQTLPVIDGISVPLDVGKVQVDTVDKYVEGAVAGTSVEALPKISRDIKQTLPVIGGTTVPLDVGKVQVDTADKYVENVVAGTSIETLPIVGLQSRQIKQSLPVVGGVDVPLNVGKIQVGTADKYVEDAVKGTSGL